jgi:hypothetical protein
MNRRQLMKRVAAVLAVPFLSKPANLPIVEGPLNNKYWTFSGRVQGWSYLGSEVVGVVKPKV